MDKYKGFTGYGEGSDCETCGYNQDTLDVSLDLESGLFDLSLMSGCYNWIADHELTQAQALEWLKHYRYEDFMVEAFDGAIEFVEAH